jgi:hypothetical protein
LQTVPVNVLDTSTAWLIVVLLSGDGMQYPLIARPTVLYPSLAACHRQGEAIRRDQRAEFSRNAVYLCIPAGQAELPAVR